MFCPECGKSINANAGFCPECGFEVIKTTTESFSDRIAKNSPIKPFFKKCADKTKKFIGNYKKQCIIAVGCFVFLFVGIIVFNSLFGFTKLSWNKDYPASELTIVTQTNLKLGLNFSDEENIDDIEISVNCGEISVDGLEILWDLTESIGKCEITARYKARKINKEFNVISFDIENEGLFLSFEFDDEIDEEWNTEAKEYEYGTYDINSNGINIAITGKGDIDSTIAKIHENTRLSGKAGLIDRLFVFYTAAEMTRAKVTIPYTLEDLEKYSLNEENLSIYYYNVSENRYEKIETYVDKANKTVTATLNHFSYYVVGDSDVVKETYTSQILFVLDNSWSMYTNAQFKELTGEDFVSGFGEEITLGGFDAAGRRFTVTSELITKLEKSNHQMGLSEFRRDYVNALPIGSNPNDLRAKLNNMYGNFITNTPGTNITNALTSGMKEFTRDSDYKYIVLLTDGEDSSLNGNAKRIIDEALKNNIKICSIGFGDGHHNVPLANISHSTGCKFYSSSNVSGLAELFGIMGRELNNNLVDVDGDNEVDGILLADSGFIVNRDGFSFRNYGSNLSSGGNCYGMALFAQLYHRKVLPLSVGPIQVRDNVVSFAFDLNDTYFGDFADLFDYSLRTNELKYIFGFEHFGEENPADLRIVDNGSLIYAPIHRLAIESSSIFRFEDAKRSSLDSAAQMERYGVIYDTHISIVFDKTAMQTSTVIHNDDRQMFNAIWAGFTKQYDANHYSSGTNFTLWARNVIGSENIALSSGPAFINILKARLNDNDAPVLSSRFNGGLHAVNAISLVQDINNPNIYYIGVYDNNYPGEKRYVDVECKKNTCLTRPNSFYSDNKQPLRITPSLEYDLLFFNQ